MPQSAMQTGSVGSSHRINVEKIMREAGGLPRTGTSRCAGFDLGLSILRLTQHDTSTKEKREEKRIGGFLI
jgi:hypothetical protein